MVCSSRGHSFRVENHRERAVPAGLACKDRVSRLGVQGQGRGAAGEPWGHCAYCGQGARFAVFN